MGATCSLQGTSCSSVFASCKSDHCASSCSEATKAVLDSTQIDEMIMNAMHKFHDKVELIVTNKLQSELAKIGIDINVSDLLSPPADPVAQPTNNIALPQLVLTRSSRNTPDILTTDPRVD